MDGEQLSVNTRGYMIRRGLSECHRLDAARLFDRAFGAKLAVAIPETSKRLDLFATNFQLKFAFGAVSEEKLLGLVGFSIESGSLTGAINYHDLISKFGILAGNRAALILGLYEQETHAKELTIDGIAVDPESRGLGVGSRLLGELIEFARANKFESIRLNVADNNSGARNLYQRFGFYEKKRTHFVSMRESLGFGATITMVCDLKTVSS